MKQAERAPSLPVASLPVAPLAVASLPAVSLISTLLLLSACATLSEEECLAGAWDAIGFDDGANGRPPDTIGSHVEACAHYDVAPDLAMWRSGYNSGLQTYCTRSNGFRVGATGQAYYGVCTGPASGDFLAALNDGALLYAIRRRLETAHGDLDAVEQEIEDLEHEREDARADAASTQISDEQRARRFDEVQRLSEEIGRLRRDQRDIERDIRDIEFDLDDVEADMRLIYPEWSGY